MKIGHSPFAVLALLGLIGAHIKNLRRKIEPDPRSPRYLQTVFGVGYRFAEPPQA